MKNDFIHHSNGTTTILIPSLDRILEARISTKHFDKVNAFPNTWLAKRDKGSRTTYVYGQVKDKKDVYLHRLIKDEPTGMQVHHRDGDGLNNTDENLEILTPSEHRRKRQPEKPFVGDPSLGVKLHILTKAHKRKGRFYWYRLDVNGKEYKTFFSEMEASLTAKIADMVINEKCTDEEILVGMPNGYDIGQIKAVIKEVRNDFRTPDPGKQKVLAKN